MSVPNPYKILQVDPEAEPEVVEAAYRRLARKYHPDVAAGPEAQERMVQINQAWELLRDPVTRAAVDRARLRAATDAARVSTVDAHVRTRAHPDPLRGRGGHSPAHPATPDPSWSAGRSGAGGGYDPLTMGTAQADGSAGPPPGNPSGSVLNFGRYAGWSLGEIARTDLEYLEWLDRMPIGRSYQFEIDGLLRSHGRRSTAPAAEEPRRGLFRRR